MKNLISLVAETVDLMHRGTTFVEISTMLKNGLGDETVDQDVLDHATDVLYAIQRGIKVRQNSVMSKLRYNEVTGESENL